MTIKVAANDALRVQDACNLSGVEFSFHTVCEVVREEVLHSQGTRAFNTHPVIVLFLSKMADLAGLGGGDLTTYGNAYEECKQLAGEGSACL